MPQDQITPDVLMPVIANLIRDESGATAIEYGLLVGALGITLMMTLGNLGSETKHILSDITWNALYRANNPEQFN